MISIGDIAQLYSALVRSENALAVSKNGFVAGDGTAGSPQGQTSSQNQATQQNQSTSRSQTVQQGQQAALLNSTSPAGQSVQPFATGSAALSGGLATSAVQAAALQNIAADNSALPSTSTTTNPALSLASLALPTAGSNPTNIATLTGILTALVTRQDGGLQQPTASSNNLASAFQSQPLASQLQSLGPQSFQFPTSQTQVPNLQISPNLNNTIDTSAANSKVAPSLNNPSNLTNMQARDAISKQDVGLSSQALSPPKILAPDQASLSATQALNINIDGEKLTMAADFPEMLRNIAMAEGSGNVGGTMSMVMLNAAMIPGWPQPPPFTPALPKKADMLNQQGLQNQFINEAEVMDYLASMGLSQALLAKIQAMAKGLGEKAKLALWLGVLTKLVSQVLKTLAREVTEEAELEELQEDEADQLHNAHHEKKRRRLFVS